MLAAAICRRGAVLRTAPLTRLDLPGKRALSSSSPEAPVLDLAAGDDVLLPQVASACSEWGFFQAVNHGVDADLCRQFRHQMTAFFDMPRPAKTALRRTGSNARGFFDDELTKQRRDWKEALDFGVPGSRDWNLPDTHPSNACLDGFNRIPDETSLPGFRTTMVKYFDEVTKVSQRLATLMAQGLDMPAHFFDELLRDCHTSYLRLNYYPVCEEAAPGTLGISPHRDAGFLTVLEQDLDCQSLQVARFTDGEWVNMAPVPNAFTINTGDMAQMWSNDRYQAPLHRVLTHSKQRRWSAPFFYNPGYMTGVKPLPSLGEPAFNECFWGYFRAQRFAGDFADFGTEIQTEDYAIGSGSPHIPRQKDFISQANFNKPFSVEEYRPLLEMN